MDTYIALDGAGEADDGAGEADDGPGETDDGHGDSVLDEADLKLVTVLCKYKKIM